MRCMQLPWGKLYDLYDIPFFICFPFESCYPICQEKKTGYCKWLGLAPTMQEETSTVLEYTFCSKHLQFK